MIKLTKVEIHKYKSFEKKQTFDVEDNITILVGMNESGKTSVLEAIAKTNYFEKDATFLFNLIHDYPRKEKKSVDKQGLNPQAITLHYSISQKLMDMIEEEMGKGVLKASTFYRTTNFDNSHINSIECNTDIFLKSLSQKNIDYERLMYKNSSSILKEMIKEQDDEASKDEIKKISKYFENINSWDNPIEEYIFRYFIQPNLPKYLYYDEYYSLPSRFSIKDLKSENLNREELKTAKALFELADINIEELVDAKDFESFKAELEATEANITDELFTYWKTNSNLSIEFAIDKIEKNDAYGGQKIVDHIMDIRVKNTRARVSLPLKNRSKGFNWFFSFLVWFKKIQEDKKSTYVILLDEPGLNLHASAQDDLLKFLDDLSKDYQVIYTTHSPFMIDSEKLHTIRTITETDNGAQISDSIKEKDPNTLFPLQAALGYNIAQNLFISKNNLLVEGVSDLVYLQVMSGILQAEGRKSLENNITIVPVGGLDKVTSFISLLRGNKLNIVCLLDTFRDPKGKAKLNDLVEDKIIQNKKIKFFDEFVDGYTEADIEDLFTKEDYLKIYNSAFPNDTIQLTDLNQNIKPILIQISKYINNPRFNHYLPANKLATRGVDSSYFSEETLNNFENLFTSINKLF